MKKFFCLSSMLFLFFIGVQIAYTQPAMNLLHSFNWDYEGPYGDGWSPGISIWGSNDPMIYNGRVYGMTLYGGLYSGSGGGGVIYSCLPNGNEYVILHQFIEDGVDYPFRPLGALIEVGGFLYGTTYFGGSTGTGRRGCIFRINPYNGEPYTADFTTLKTFNYPDDIYYPHNSLLYYNNKLWGSCEGGPQGATGDGGLFYFDLLTNTYAVVHIFNEFDISSCKCNLTLYNNRMYGITTYGGANYGGVVFSIDPNAVGFDFQAHSNFPASTNPVHSLVELDGMLYCASYNGGSSGNTWGAIWKFNPLTNNLEVAYSFDPYNGGYGPHGGLLVFNDKLWGTAFYGGEIGCGTIYSFDPSDNTYQCHFSFVCTPGEIPAHPTGSLVYYDNYLYGVTKSGGVNNDGTVYRYGPFAQPASVVTGDYGDLAPTSVRLFGEITNTGGENCTERGFCYSDVNEEPTVEDLIVFDFGSFGAGEFNLLIDNLLTQNTTYYYRAYTVNSTGTYYGDVLEFTTPLPNLAAPLLIAPSDNSIVGITTPTFQWNPVEAATSYTLQVSTDPNFESFAIDIALADPWFTPEVPLENFTTYYWRAKGINELQDGDWSDVWTFSISQITLPTVSTSIWGELTSTTAHVFGDIFNTGGEDCTQRGFCFSSTNEEPTVEDNVISEFGLFGPDVFDMILTDLTPNTTYYYRAFAENSVGFGYGNVLSFTTEEPEEDIQLLYFIQGWNLLSSYINPTNPNFAEIFSSVANNIIIAKNQAGQIYSPQYGINDIGNWNPEESYQFYTNSFFEFDFTGQILIPPENPIILQQGWNYISYLRTSPMAIEEALASILDNIIIVKNRSNLIFVPAFQINTIGNMLPGQGYRIFVNQDVILTYPDY